MWSGYLLYMQVDELKPAPDFSSGPLREFGQPRDADWIHDAFSASKWSTPGKISSFSPYTSQKVPRFNLVPFIFANQGVYISMKMC